MPQRGYVLIFVFWALLTIITPTLIFWSASAKPSLYAQEEARIEMKARRMMASLEIGIRKQRTKSAIAIASPAPSPSPVPLPGRGDY